MLAISATGTLSLLDPAVIKRAPSSAPSCLTLIQLATSSVWSADNAFLFLSSAKVIQRYEPSSNSVKEFYTTGDAEEISHLVCKDKGSLVFSTANRIHILDCGSTPKVSQTFESHKSPITSLSISNDSSLLASTSANAVHVHNLSLGSHTVLRGLALAGQTITTSAFHPHTRTRLLLGIGKQLAVYDTTRPSGPLKMVPLGETTPGNIIAVACSPFSKTLVAVATSGGNVGLIDLDKDKGLFRTLNLKVPLTSIGFSPEGAAVYLGTEHGKLLVMDLRALDKPPKIITISETGCRIETMCVQKKVKGGPDSATKPMTATASKSSTPLEVPPRRPTTQAQPAKAGVKPAPSPSRARTARVDSTASPGRRLPSTMKDTSPKKPAPAEKKKVFSPVRDPLGNSTGDISVEIESLSAMRGANKVTPVKADRKPSVSARPRLSSSPRVISGTTSISATSASLKRTTRGAEGKEHEKPRRTRTVPTATRSRKNSTTTPAGSVSAAATATAEAMLTVPGESHGQICSRSRAASSASRTGSDGTSAVSARSLRPSSSASRPGSSISRAVFSHAVSRTPSPDLPDMDMDPVTPIPAAKRNRIGVLGLGTPELDQWIQAGNAEDGGNRKGKGKSVGFKRDEEEESDADHDVDHEELDRERGLTMQVSPLRPDVGSSTSWEPSPLRCSIPRSPAGIAGSSAHDLLRTIVQDVMYDFQSETKAEMMGLHLDLVRMGRAWKKDLRDLMEEHVGGLNELREENRRLREENEMLRRRSY